jgi:hypothetical protein
MERKVERIGACKKWKTGDQLDLYNRRHTTKPILKLESNHQLSADGNQSGVMNCADPRLVNESACEGLDILQKVL